MSQPNRFRIAVKEKIICKLKMSLYGLKQSLRQWYKHFDHFMLNRKYTRSQFDHYVYFKKFADGSFIYLLLYVDDMLVTCKTKWR